MLTKHLKATNIELTPAIEDYLEKKLVSLEKFIDDDMDALAKIEVGRTTKHHNKGDIFRAEINLEMAKNFFRAVSEKSDLYSAIDEMKDQIIAEVSKTKRKRAHLLKRGHQKIKNLMRKFVGRGQE